MVNAGSAGCETEPCDCGKGFCDCGGFAGCRADGVSRWSSSAADWRGCGVFSDADGNCCRDEVVVAENASDLPGDERASEGLLWCVETEDEGWWVVSIGIGLRAGEGPRARERYGSSAAFRPLGGDC